MLALVTMLLCLPAAAVAHAAGRGPGPWGLTPQFGGLSPNAGTTSPAGSTGATGDTGATGTTTPPYSIPQRPLPAPPSIKASNPLAGRAVWIWELPDSSGGNVAAIIARAHRNGVRTLMAKSSDGTSMWSQFNPALVAAFHAAHLNVCAWQFVYGEDPTAEAERGAQAVKDGADCLVIDAEGQYEGKYVSAQTYVTTLRRLIGADFPVALAGLPYIDDHPAFPYSVFLGPGGAQFDMPQMYWRAIGTSVDDVFTHTYAFNRLYGRAILPLGQIYGSPPISQIIRFRQLAQLNGARGVSWWDYQQAQPADFTAISRPIGRPRGVAKVRTLATLSRGTEGDLVVWAQEHLDGAGFSLAIDGDFGKLTQAAVARYQALHGLPITGSVDGDTWASLLRVTPMPVTWVHHRKGNDTAEPASVRRGGMLTQAVPRSAGLPDRGRDIPANLGAGQPSLPRSRRKAYGRPSTASRRFL